MTFIRCLDKQSVKLQTGENAGLFALLKKDIAAGKVFPAVRKNELDFYYKGGCLYKFKNGRFQRDGNYERYNKDTEGLPPYERAKKQNENKFTNTAGNSAERQLLDGLYCHTFNAGLKKNVVVLDIEVNLNGTIGGGKKCDLVLFNTLTREIMFVEGKVFSDSRVKTSAGHVPEVISQVGTYTAAIAEQRGIIISAYGEHVKIVNSLFGTNFIAPQTLIEPAKLLVYETPEAYYDCIKVIDGALGKNNVLWLKRGKAPSPDEIWSKLCN